MRPIRLLSRLACAALVATVVACGGGADEDEEAMAGLAEERIEAPPVAAVADGAAARTTVDAAIEAARAAGEIDAETALAARVLALAGDARLPARFRAAASGHGDIDEVDGNAVLADLRAAWPAPMRRLLARDRRSSRVPGHAQPRQREHAALRR